jgi:hypothetical protein
MPYLHAYWAARATELLTMLAERQEPQPLRRFTEQLSGQCCFSGCTKDRSNQHAYCYPHRREMARRRKEAKNA